jgi:hypothetical protein
MSDLDFSEIISNNEPAVIEQPVELKTVLEEENPKV